MLRSLTDQSLEVAKEKYKYKFSLQLDFLPLYLKNGNVLVPAYGKQNRNRQKVSKIKRKKRLAKTDLSKESNFSCG